MGYFGDRHWPLLNLVEWERSERDVAFSLSLPNYPLSLSSMLLRFSSSLSTSLSPLRHAPCALPLYLNPIRRILVTPFSNRFSPNKENSGYHASFRRLLSPTLLPPLLTCAVWTVLLDLPRLYWIEGVPDSLGEWGSFWFDDGFGWRVTLWKWGVLLWEFFSVVVFMSGVMGRWVCDFCFLKKLIFWVGDGVWWGD